jgi:hypothetical protein
MQLVKQIMFIVIVIVVLPEGHASVCAVCPQQTGCTHADATTESYDSQSHGYVERRQSSAAADTTRAKERRRLGGAHSVCRCRMHKQRSRYSS